MNADGEIYDSPIPGQFGGSSKLNIYGRLDCSSAASTINRNTESTSKTLTSTGQNSDYSKIRRHS